MANSAACNTTSAQAFEGIAHAIHSTLLTIKIQNPYFRRSARLDATIHEAVMVTAIAGHCNKSKKFMFQMLASFGYAACHAGTGMSQALKDTHQYQYQNKTEGNAK